MSISWWLICPKCSYGHRVDCPCAPMSAEFRPSPDDQSLIAQQFRKIHTSCEALEKERDELKALHEQACKYVIPGECDTSDAYRKMLQTLRATNTSYEAVNVAYLAKIKEQAAKLTISAQALEMLVSYTEACEGLLNASPAGQVKVAREALAKIKEGV